MHASTIFGHNCSLVFCWCLFVLCWIFFFSFLSSLLVSLFLFCGFMVGNKQVFSLCLCLWFENLLLFLYLDFLLPLSWSGPGMDIGRDELGGGMEMGEGNEIGGSWVLCPCLCHFILSGFPFISFRADNKREEEPQHPSLPNCDQSAPSAPCQKINVGVKKIFRSHSSSISVLTLTCSWRKKTCVCASEYSEDGLPFGLWCCVLYRYSKHYGSFLLLRVPLYDPCLCRVV